MAGKLIVLAGPSGVGKGTIVKALLERNPDFYLSISFTTRPPRSGEVDGKDYFFIAREDFEAMIRDNKFLEWAEYAGNYYGTPKLAVEEKIASGKSVLLEIELAGARKIEKTFPSALRIFILPPSMTELERRLKSRGKDSEAVISQRLEIAKKEIEAKDEFDARIINEDIESAAIEIEAIVASRD